MSDGKKIIQISNKLPQFDEIKALFIVTGRQEAKFYLAHNGKFSLIDYFLVSHPKYSDKEGHFMVRGGGKVYGQGSVCELPRQEIRQKFIKLFKVNFKKLKSKEDFDAIYLFSPVAKEVLDNLNKQDKEKVRKIIRKDYYHEHQFKLLEAIK